MRQRTGKLRIARVRSVVAVGLHASPMHLHSLPCCALLLLAALAGPAKALDNSHADLAARSGRQEPIAEPINAAVTATSGPSVGGQAPWVQARWSARSETWRSSNRWSSTNGSLVTDLTGQARHSTRLALGYPVLRQTEGRRLGLFEGAARHGPQQAFIDKLDVGWTLSRAGEPLPRQARGLGRS
jgi:hypothetical protein